MKESGKILYQFWKYLQIVNLRPNAWSETRLKLSKETLISQSLSLNLREKSFSFSDLDPVQEQEDADSIHIDTEYVS